MVTAVEELMRRGYDRFQAINTVRKQIARDSKRLPGRMTLLTDDLVRQVLPDEATRPILVWMSNKFLAQLFDLFDQSSMRLTVCRTEVGWDGEFVGGITWDELMLVKAECGYASKWMVEVYPAEEGVVNVANMRHLWLVDECEVRKWDLRGSRKQQQKKGTQ